MLADPNRRGFRRRPLSMTSLIDVIFLLLLFFMLSSTFSKYAEIELLSAGAGQVDAAAQAPFFLRLEPENLSFNGQAHRIEDLAEVLEAIGDNSGEKAVIISLSGAVNAQRLVDLLAILRAVDGITVHVLGAG